MVRKIETGLVFLPILVGVVFLGWAIHTIEAEDAVNEAGARALGFADFTEEASAKAVGVLTADAWRAKLADDLANKKAADEALAKAQEERRRKWDADAPKRASW